MLLPIKTISDLLKRERNLSAIAKKVGLTHGTLSRIAKKDDANIDVSTLQALSDYFVSEFNHMKNHIIELRGE